MAAVSAPAPVEAVPGSGVVYFVLDGAGVKVGAFVLPREAREAAATIVGGFVVGERVAEPAATIDYYAD